MTPAPLPPPACRFGYTERQIEAIVGDRLAEFSAWFRGQTGAVCEGRRWDPDARGYVPDACAANPHGFVVYPWDLEKFLATRKVRETDGTHSP